MGPVSESQVQFWMAKAVDWGEATSPSVQQDTGRHLGELRGFLLQVLQSLQQASSTTEAIRTLPFVGQFLGRLCWNPYVTADEQSQTLLLQCLWCLYSVEPQSAVERRANEWIRTLLCQLASEEENTVQYALISCAGLRPREYTLRTLEKMVSVLTEEIRGGCVSLTNPSERCSCENVRHVSVASVPLVTCPQASPLIGGLLKRPVTCNRGALCEEFIEAVSIAWLEKKLVIEEPALIALWCHSLTSLEGAVMSLIESVLSGADSMPQNIEDKVTDSLLAKASALDCSIFLTVNEIFRAMLMELDGNLQLHALIHTFTRCFLHTLGAQRLQESPSLKAYFPLVPLNLLTPLLTSPSEVPKETWQDHVSWISALLQKITEKKEEEDKEESPRWCRDVFEAWFLLVQCGDWVDVATQLLVLPESEGCLSLLWLIHFYHHPTNRGHQSSQQMSLGREVCDHLRMLFLGSPLPCERVVAIRDLLSSTLSSNLVLHLLLNFAIFSQGSITTCKDIMSKVLIEQRVKHVAAWAFTTIRHRLNRDASKDARVQSRLRTIQEVLGSLP
ncbi:Fanconi anemia group C protein [Chanos chanos]|uniref:Fanconi anemia group C protein n=1 Tax=Chanos chanos TaxID=29144 RepID=A0A6J2UL10_CHACN|nr:Fanconi anemia group C protein [Chanos chanos]